MTTNSKTELIAQDNSLALKLTTSPRVQEIITLGQHEFWNFTVLGQAPMPTQPIRLDDWLIVPAEQDSSEIPERALDRIQAIFAAGIRPQGFVLVHEAPMLLPAPEKTQVQTLQSRWMLNPETTQKAIKTLGFGVAGLTTVLAGAVTLAAAVSAVIVPAFFMAAATVIDPILIAVTEDNYWVEIDRWWV